METRPYQLTHSPPISLEIKYGVNKVSAKGSRFPSKLDHLIVVSRERGQMNYLMLQEVMDALGTDTPKSIPIQLLSDVPAENFPLFRGLWSKKDGALWCGAIYGEDTALRRFRTDNGGFESVPQYEVPCNEKCEYWQDYKCALSGTLYFRLANHLPYSERLGVLRVKGIYAMKRLTAGLDIIARQTGGVLANLPLQVTLHYETKKVSSGEMQKIPLLSIEPALGTDNFLDALETEMQRRKRLHELMGFPMKVQGALAHVDNREAVGETQGEADADEVVEVQEPVDPEIAEITKDLPKRKAEILVQQATDEDGVDKEKLQELVEKDAGRKTRLEIDF